MKLYDVEHIARTINGDAYYEEIRMLKDDIEFFSAYVRRNRKSNFSFILIPCQQSTYTAFKDIYEAFGLNSLYIDNAYAIYTVMKAIIIDTYEQTMKFNSGQIREFAEYLNNDFEMNIEDYVGCFVGCSYGVKETKKMLYDMINKC
jgi:hypothetical protein